MFEITWGKTKNFNAFSAELNQTINQYRASLAQNAKLP